MLQVCWDSRSQEEGGQRWYLLYADEEIPHSDELHWTREHFNWNYMCADCHSTELEKNYHVRTDTYATTWQEMNVGCEACHGAGSKHLDWAAEVAEREVPDGGYGHRTMGLNNVLKEPTEGFWTLDPATLQPRRTEALQSNVQVESCAPCHSHRRLLAHPWRHGHQGEGLYETHAPSILDQALYHDDGQIKEEVYVYGSFVQSRMFHHGVRCSDCHDPHSLELRAPGNSLCIQCHSGKAYDSPEHHRHQVGARGPHVWIAICRENTTWGSIGGGTTASGSRGLTWRSVWDSGRLFGLSHGPGCRLGGRALSRVVWRSSGRDLGASRA